MKITTTSDVIIAVLMWLTFLAYVIGAALAYRLRFHIDTSKMSEPDQARRALRMIGLPPSDVLTEHGRKLRKAVMTLWLAGGIPFFILVFWKTLAK